MAATTLPALDSPRIQELRLSERPHHYSAYKMILEAERHAVQQEDIISARVTGYLLLEFHAQSDILGDEASASLIRWVTSPPQSAGGNVIFDVGKMCCDNFIRLFRSSNPKYPPPSSHPSRPSFGTLEDMNKDSMECVGNDYETSRMHISNPLSGLLIIFNHLARDGYRCMVSGMFDHDSLLQCAGLAAMARGSFRGTVHTCHILNESVMQGSAMTMLEQFGFSKFTDVFKQSGVHSVWNLLSLEAQIHTKFDRLDLWFESTHQLECDAELEDEEVLTFDGTCSSTQ